MAKLELYHGSPMLFEAFSQEVEPRFDAGHHVLGLFLTDAEYHARVYAFHTEDELDEYDDLDADADGYVYSVEATVNSIRYEPPHASGLSLIEYMQLNFGPSEYDDYLAQVIEDGHDCICFETNDGVREFALLDYGSARIVGMDVVARNNADYRL